MSFSKRYSGLVRRTYRVLRHPKLRKYKWLQKMTLPFFDRDLWKPCEHTVAKGLSLGLFCMMLPVPGQTLIAALAAVKARANMPICVAITWLTNPATQLFFFHPQSKVGGWFLSLFGVKENYLSSIRFNMPFSDRIIDFAKLEIKIWRIDQVFTPSYFLNIVIGSLVLGVTLAAIAFPLVHIIAVSVPRSWLHPVEAVKARRAQKLTERQNVSVKPNQREVD